MASHDSTTRPDLESPGASSRTVPASWGLTLDEWEGFDESAVEEGLAKAAAERKARELQAQDPTQK